jgi:hypothetical protein
MELNVQGLEHATNATSVCVGMVAMATPASAATPHAAEEEPTQPCVLAMGTVSVMSANVHPVTPMMLVTVQLTLVDALILFHNQARSYVVIEVHVSVESVSVGQGTPEPFVNFALQPQLRAAAILVRLITPVSGVGILSTTTSNLLCGHERTVLQSVMAFWMRRVTIGVERGSAPYPWGRAMWCSSFPALVKQTIKS